MKSRHLYFLAAGLISFGALAQNATNTGAAAAAPPPPQPQTSMAKAPDKEAISAAFGSWYSRLTTNELFRRGDYVKTNLDAAKFLEAYSNTFIGSPAALPLEQVTNLLQQEAAYEKARIFEETEKAKSSGPENKAKGIKFLEDNAKLPGVISLTNGMQYKVLKAGDGAKPTTNDIAMGSLIARTIDGVEFIRLENREIPVINSRLPEGFSKAIQMMNAGSKWLIYLPYQLAYGDHIDPFAGANQAPKFGPNSALVFEVDLDSVKPKPPPPPPRTAPPRTPPPASSAPTGSAPGQPASARISSSDIVRVPSAEEMKRGSNLEVGSLEHFIQQQTNAAHSATNAPAAK